MRTIKRIFLTIIGGAGVLFAAFVALGIAGVWDRPKPGDQASRPNPPAIQPRTNTPATPQATTQSTQAAPPTIPRPPTQTAPPPPAAIDNAATSRARLDAQEGAETMIIRATRMPGYIGMLAHLCGIRNEEWLTELATIITGQAVDAAQKAYPPAADATLHPLASGHFGGGESQARMKILEDGASKGCAGIRSNPILINADKTVSDYRRNLPALIRSLKPITD